MAPEQARGLPATPATDLYSVGVVLYEMLAGRPPFAAGTAVDLALRHLQEAPPPLPPDVAPALASVVARALEKDPARRYPTAAAMVAGLAAARAGGRGQTVPAAPATASGHATGSSGRERPSSGHASRSSGHALGSPGHASGSSGRERPSSGHESATSTRRGPAMGPDGTRVAPGLGPRRNVNPAARRRAVALLAPGRRTRARHAVRRAPDRRGQPRVGARHARVDPRRGAARAFPRRSLPRASPAVLRAGPPAWSSRSRRRPSAASSAATRCGCC